MKSKGIGQIYWLIVSLFAKKEKYARPFLVYRINSEDYVLLKISSSLKNFIPQFEFPPHNKPSTFYKKRNFVDPNILICVKHDLFSHKINEIAATMETKEQGEP